MYHLNCNPPEPENAQVELTRAAYHRAVLVVNVAASWGVLDSGLIRDAGNAFTAYRHAITAARTNTSNRRPPTAQRAYPTW